MTSTRKDFGDQLLSPGIRQPTGSLNIDAYGLAQGQLTFAVDSDNSNLTDVIDTYEMGVDWPGGSALGFDLRSYKYHLGFEKGGVSMLTVDYVGIARGVGYTDAQITGVANTQAQPIETHPNFTTITQPLISSNILAGSPTGTKFNNAIFTPVANTSPVQYSFGGFGLTNTTNKKAGVRQYLRPMVNIRGQIFFNYATIGIASKISQAVGWLVPSDSDLAKLIAPIVPPADSAKKCLITSVNLECIGTPDSTHIPVTKVSYDLLIANDMLGWDTDIYGKYPSSFFS